jgi:hypothetical protein
MLSVVLTDVTRNEDTDSHSQNLAVLLRRVYASVGTGTRNNVSPVLRGGGSKIFRRSAFCASRGILV